MFYTLTSHFKMDSMLSFILTLVCFLILPLMNCNEHLYSDQFVVQIEGGREMAKQLADEHGFDYLGEVFDGHYHLQHKKITKPSLKKSAHHNKILSNDDRVKSHSQQLIKRRQKRSLRTVSSTRLNDPKWPDMWYLNRGPGLDMNVEAAWAAGATGKGIVVTILDDGLEKDHPDIMQNYDPEASYDINDRDLDPHPRYDHLDSNRHGTRCAGEVAASANNSLCSVGIAFGAKVGGIRMLDGDVTDAVEARAVGYNNQHIDIYSASWGPGDDGRTVDGPDDLMFRAFRDGATKGRGGKGNIFVWASGNGGRYFDNCNCDGYTMTIWTLSISSATEHGTVPWYSEACSSTLAATYSSGSTTEKQVVTTDLRHGCTTDHTGTSASAPLAAGICALALEANPNLTWRDMQHIVVRAANPQNLYASDWTINGVGRNVSHSFGYGMMDAAAMVHLAKHWVSVPAQQICEFRRKEFNRQRHIKPNGSIELTMHVHCPNLKYLEHVQSKLNIIAPRRGSLHIYLTSPMGTKSTLLAKRPLDKASSGFPHWPFMTVHSWGENPNGVWTLAVSYDAPQSFSDFRSMDPATLFSWYLVLYGTGENPDRKHSHSHGSNMQGSKRSNDREDEASHHLNTKEHDDDDDTVSRKLKHNAAESVGKKLWSELVLLSVLFIYLFHFITH